MKRIVARIVFGLTLILWSAGPIIWMILASLRDRHDLLNEPDRVFPRHLTLSNYRTLFTQADFFDSVLRSAEVAIACTAITLILAAATSYSLARYRIRGMKFVRGISIWAYLFPPVVIVLPFFVLLRTVSLQDTIVGLLLAHVAFCFPFAIWLLYPFMRSLPSGLEEAAAADGATVLQVIWHVVLPVSWPGILAVASFCFSLSWSDYLFARVLLGSGSRTLPVFIFDLYTGTIVDWGMLMSAGTASVLPVTLLVALTHRHIAAGFAAAGIRG